MGQRSQGLKQQLLADRQASPSVFGGVMWRFEARAPPFTTAPDISAGFQPGRAPTPSTSWWTRGSTCCGRGGAAGGRAGVVGHPGRCAPHVAPTGPEAARHTRGGTYPLT